MATTAIWDVQANGRSVSDVIRTVVEYVANPKKTRNPDFDPATADEFEALVMSQDAMGSMGRVLNYATMDEKTDRHQFVSGINCSLENVEDRMILTKKRWNKMDGVVLYHGYQSFAEYDNITPDQVHMIGLELAERLWGERFEVIVTTHLDKWNHLHNHFALNSVSFVDGKRYHDNKATYAQMRHVSDELCRKYGLSIVDPEKSQKQRRDHYLEWDPAAAKGPTGRAQVCEDIDMLVRSPDVQSWRDLVLNLERMGYEIRESNRKHISIKSPKMERFVRIDKLPGGRYTQEALIRRIDDAKSRRLNTQKRQARRSTASYSTRQARFDGRWPVFFPRRITVKSLRVMYMSFVRRLEQRAGAYSNSPIDYETRRRELRKLNEYSAMYRYLAEHRLNSIGELEKHGSELYRELNALLDIKASLKADGRTPSRELLSRIREKENEVKQCRRVCNSLDGILKRNQASVRENRGQQRRKEVNYYEY